MHLCIQKQKEEAVPTTKTATKNKTNSKIGDKPNNVENVTDLTPSIQRGMTVCAFYVIICMLVLSMKRLIKRDRARACAYLLLTFAVATSPGSSIKDLPEIIAAIDDVAWRFSMAKQHGKSSNLNDVAGWRMSLTHQSVSACSETFRKPTNLTL